LKTDLNTVDEELERLDKKIDSKPHVSENLQEIDQTISSYSIDSGSTFTLRYKHPSALDFAKSSDIPHKVMLMMLLRNSKKRYVKKRLVRIDACLTKVL
jgi:hypothetical protein